VQLTGSLCDDAKAGRFSQIKFTHGCLTLLPVMIKPPT
jgi:hypothetical protein